MSRPCFALSVVLCCLAGPLLVIGKTHAQDAVVSPSHDPGQCIVCPLAHGPPEVCGGYSDYDYNHYLFDDPATPAAETPAAETPATEATAEANPETEVTETPVDGSTDQPWESSYEDYYADYAFGDESLADAEDQTAEQTPDPAESTESSSETALAADVPQDDPAAELYDDYEWHTDDSAPAEDYFDSFDSYEPIDPAESEANSVDEPNSEAADIDYEAYEKEWFSYETEATVETSEIDEASTEATTKPSTDESSDDLAAENQISETPSANESWGDEEDWYREEYGYENAWSDASTETSADLDSTEPSETGYDEAYDEAMAIDSEAAEATPDASLPDSSSELPELDDYETFYDAYDALYDFDATASEVPESDPGTASLAPEAGEPEAGEPEAGEPGEQASDPQSAWLTALINRMLAPVWMTADGTPTDESTLDPDSRGPIYVDECAQEWDCELDYWARPEVEQSSIVLDAADTLDGMATALQEAAEFLREFAGGRVAANGSGGQHQTGSLTPLDRVGSVR